MKKLVLVGCGGHFKSVYDSICQSSYDEIVVIDDMATSITGYDVVLAGKMDAMQQLFDAGFHYIHLCIGALQARMAIIERARAIGFTFETIIDATAVVSERSTIGAGVFIGKRAVVNAHAVVHDHVILNTGCIIEHDCTVHANAHIAPGVVLTGAVTIGAQTLIGAGSVVLPKVSVGDHAVIGSNSTVVASIQDAVIAYGSPCEVKRDV